MADDPEGRRRLGKAVEAARSDLRMSRAEFAHRIGYSVTTVGILERGMPRRVGDEVLREVEAALGWAPGDAILYRDGQPVRTDDPERNRLDAMWPRLSVDARRVLVAFAEYALDRRP